MDLALTLVLIQRSKIRKVATFDERLAHYEIDVVTARTMPSTTLEPEAD